jgi:preprotein translocase subunit SecG
MTTVLLVIHILLALALIGVVLLQRSEGGGLGIGGGGGGGGGGMGGFLTGRGTANLLTRTTAILAAGFMLTSITLTILAGGGAPSSITEGLGTSAPANGVPAPEPVMPSEPSVPTQ